MVFLTGCSSRNEVKSKYFSITIPHNWQHEWEKDVDYDTLMVWKDGSNSTLRISSLVLESTGNFSAEENIQEDQQKYGGEISQNNGFYVLSFEEETTENGVPLIIHFWLLDKSNQIFTISFTMKKEEANLTSTKAEMEEIKNFMFNLKII